MQQRHLAACRLRLREEGGRDVEGAAGIDVIHATGLALHLHTRIAQPCSEPVGKE